MDKTFLPKTLSDFIFIIFAVCLILTFLMLNKVVGNQNKILLNQSEFRKSYASLQKTLDDRGPRIFKLEKDVNKLVIEIDNISKKVLNKKEE